MELTELGSFLLNYSVKDGGYTTDGYFYGLFISMGQLLNEDACTDMHTHTHTCMQTHYHAAFCDVT